MGLDTYLPFLIATFVLLVVPGPTVMLVVGYALSGGRRTVAYTAPGVALGDATAMIVSLAGLGALLAASATAFTVLKWVGAAYLIWLGIKLWRARPTADLLATSPAGPTTRRCAPTGRAMLRDAWIVTALNPKGIVFFMAFLPQFIAPDAAYIPQVMVLGGTFLVLGTVNAALFGLLAGSASRLVQNRHVQLWINRTGGTFLIGAGLMTATLKRT